MSSGRPKRVRLCCSPAFTISGLSRHISSVRSTITVPGQMRLKPHAVGGVGDRRGARHGDHAALMVRIGVPPEPRSPWIEEIVDHRRLFLGAGTLQVRQRVLRNEEEGAQPGPVRGLPDLLGDLADPTILVTGQPASAALLTRMSSPPRDATLSSMRWTTSASTGQIGPKYLAVPPSAWIPCTARSPPFRASARWTTPSHPRGRTSARSPDRCRRWNR